MLPFLKVSRTENKCTAFGISFKINVTYFYITFNNNLVGCVWFIIVNDIVDSVENIKIIYIGSWNNIFFLQNRQGNYLSNYSWQRKITKSKVNKWIILIKIEMKKFNKVWIIRLIKSFSKSTCLLCNPLNCEQVTNTKNIKTC